MAAAKRTWLLVLAALIVLTAAYLALGRGADTPRDDITRDDASREEQLDAREPADFGQLKEAYETTRRAVDDEDWSAAEEGAHRVRTRWVSFKPGMRAGAGVRMWTTADMNDFESALSTLERTTSERDVTGSKEALDALEAILDRNDPTRRESAIQ